MLRAMLIALACAAAPVAPAHAQEDERMQAAHEVLAETHATDLVRETIVGQRDLYVAALQQQGLPADRAQRLWTLFIEEVEVDLPRVEALAAQAYADAFTVEQLRSLRDFYRTDAGRALVEKTPELTALMARVGFTIGEQAGARAAQRMAQENRPSGP